jgi:hypothetical protein
MTLKTMCASEQTVVLPPMLAKKGRGTPEFGCINDQPGLKVTIPSDLTE